MKPFSGRFKQGSGELVFAVGGQAFDRLHQLTFGDAEIVDQESCTVGAGEMLESLQVGLPIPYILVVKAVDDVFAHNGIRLIHIRLILEQSGRNQICLVYCTALLAAPYRAQDLLAKPYQISFEQREHGSGDKVSRQWLVTVQQMLRMRCNKDVDGIEQPLEIAFRHERSAEVGHDEVANKHHTDFRQMDEHGIVSFSAADRDEFDACTPDLQLSTAGDGDIRSKATHIVEVEAFTEKRYVEGPRRFDYSGKLLLIVAPRIETRVRIQTAEIGVASHVVPVSVCYEDGRQWWQTRDLCMQCLIGGLCRILPRTGIDADEFSFIVRYNEIVFGKLEAR